MIARNFVAFMDLKKKRISLSLSEVPGTNESVTDLISNLVEL